jgi:hypothetical protein
LLSVPQNLPTIYRLPSFQLSFNRSESESFNVYSIVTIFQQLARNRGKTRYANVSEGLIGTIFAFEDTVYCLTDDFDIIPEGIVKNIPVI